MHRRFIFKHLWPHLLKYNTLVSHFAQLKKYGDTVQVLRCPPSPDLSALLTTRLPLPFEGTPGPCINPGDPFVWFLNKCYMLHVEPKTYSVPV